MCIEEYVEGLSVVASGQSLVQTSCRSAPKARYIPPSVNLSNRSLSTLRVPSRPEMRAWYFPSCAVLSEPIASAGPFTETTGAGAVMLESL